MRRPHPWLFTMCIGTVAGLGIAAVLLHRAGPAPRIVRPATAAISSAAAADNGTAIGADGETDWLRLMPPEDIAALQNLSPVTHQGSEVPGNYAMGSIAASAGLDVFSSFSTVLAMHKKQVRLGGFIVPLATNSENELVEFFLVPYFGACIHTPPPPPNQIVHVMLPKPIAMTDLYMGYWVQGELRIKLFMNDMGGSAYQIADASVTPWN